jgi:hypothetical protein
VFSTRSVQQLRAAKVDFFGAVFSMYPVPRCYKQDKSRIRVVVMESPARKDVNKEANGSTALGAVARQPSKAHQSENIKYVL